MALAKGDKAPNFKLLDTERNEVSLSDYEGKNLVVLFFPLAFTSVCTTELCTMRDNLSEYNALNAEVVGISVDSPFTLAKFKEEQELNFKLLSDFNKTVAKSYDAWYDQMLGLEGIAKRAAFVVGPDGKIKHTEVLADAGKLPDFEAIKASLK